jgi:uncharacterized protein (UPF0333 family)
MRKDNLLLLFLALITTIAAIYFWRSNQELKNTNSLLRESISLHKKAIAVEAKSYYAINDCFVINRGLCNANDFKTKLQSLGNESDSLYNQISLLEAKLK